MSKWNWHVCGSWRSLTSGCATAILGRRLGQSTCCRSTFMVTARVTPTDAWSGSTPRSVLPCLWDCWQVLLISWCIHLFDFLASINKNNSKHYILFRIFSFLDTFLSELWLKNAERQKTFDFCLFDFFSFLCIFWRDGEEGMEFEFDRRRWLWRRRHWVKEWSDCVWSRKEVTE